MRPLWPQGHLLSCRVQPFRAASGQTDQTRLGSRTYNDPTTTFTRNGVTILSRSIAVAKQMSCTPNSRWSCCLDRRGVSVGCHAGDATREISRLARCASSAAGGFLPFRLEPVANICILVAADSCHESVATRMRMFATGSTLNDRKPPAAENPHRANRDISRVASPAWRPTETPRRSRQQPRDLETPPNGRTSEK